MAARSKKGVVAGVADAPAPELVADAILPPDEAVRWQAGNLRDAIIAARAAGYIVNTPFRIIDLDRIVISATAKVVDRPDASVGVGAFSEMPDDGAEIARQNSRSADDLLTRSKSGSGSPSPIACQSIERTDAIAGER